MDFKRPEEGEPKEIITNGGILDTVAVAGGRNPVGQGHMSGLLSI